MKKKPYVGIRTKALLAVVMLVLLPSLFLAVLTYGVKDEAVSAVEKDMMQQMDAQASKYAVQLNRNATSCIDTYLHGIEMEGKSAANVVKEYIGKNGSSSNVVWGSRNLLEQMNRTMIEGIMSGTIQNQYYTEIVNTLNGSSVINAALNYFLDTPTLDYRTPHVNESAYEAINAVAAALGDRSRILYDFLYSIMLAEYQRELDAIIPVGEMLYSFREEKDVLWSYYASANSGFIVLVPSSADFSPLFNPFVRAWYTKALDESAPVWSDTYIDEITKMPMVTFSVPVYTNAEPEGVMGFDLLLSTLTDKSRQFYSGGESFAFAMDSGGVALSYPDENVIGGSLLSGNTEFNRSIGAILNGTSGGFHTNISGKEAFLAYSTINRTGWKFVNVIYCEDILRNAEKSADSVGRIVEKQIIYIVSLILAVGLTSFIVTFFLVDSSIRDLEHLTKAANDVSRGKFDVDIKTNGKDEIGELQRAMKRMVNSIRVAMEELERREK